MLKINDIAMDAWHDVVWWVLLPLALSSLAVMWVYPLLLRLARRKNFVDTPNWRRLNRRPVPVMGGVVVFFGLIFGLTFTGCFVEELTIGYYLIAAMVIMLMTGVADDAVGLTPRVRIVVECAVVAMICWLTGDMIDNLYGLWGITLLPMPLAMVLTVIGGVGVINAVNLMDGVDGLCAGYGMLLSMVCGLSFFAFGDGCFAVLCAALLGALIPFWLRNVYGGRRKMFLGDGGSLLLGLLTVVCLLRFYAEGAVVLRGYVLSLCFAMLSVPVLDTLRVMFGRILQGRSPFSPDCSHLHHAFIRLGLSHKLTSLCILAMQATILGVGWLCRWMSVGFDVALYTVAVVAVVIIWGGYAVAELLARRALPAGTDVLTKDIE